jgi:HAD superfamily hydrolase (TIGR01662 family)
MIIKAVLFDLGETLLHYGKVNVSALLHQAAQLTYQFLQECNDIKEKSQTFRRYHRLSAFTVKWRCVYSYLSHREFNGLTLLKQILEKMKIRPTPEQLQELAWLWYKPAADLATMEPDLPQHLQKLRDMSLELAIISNTFSPAAVIDRHLQQLDLLRFFPLRQYSSDTIFRKPDRRIYQDTLEKLNLRPDQTVMVGDRLREDIRGAQKLGIKAVLKHGLNNQNKTINRNHIPVIHSIAELPDLIRNWPT